MNALGLLLFAALSAWALWPLLAPAPSRDGQVKS